MPNQKLEYFTKVLLSAIEENDFDDINRMVYSLKKELISTGKNQVFNIWGKKGLQLNWIDNRSLQLEQMEKEVQQYLEVSN
ncbi:MAG: hypothetical protein ACW990_00105 [Promethearchaeota archaeon]|jgi:hypothetical protein